MISPDVRLQYAVSEGIQVDHQHLQSTIVKAELAKAGKQQINPAAASHQITEQLKADVFSSAFIRGLSELAWYLEVANYQAPAVCKNGNLLLSRVVDSRWSIVAPHLSKACNAVGEVIPRAQKMQPPLSLSSNTFVGLVAALMKLLLEARVHVDMRARDREAVEEYVLDNVTATADLLTVVLRQQTGVAAAILSPQALPRIAGLVRLDDEASYSICVLLQTAVHTAMQEGNLVNLLTSAVSVLLLALDDGSSKCRSAAGWKGLDLLVASVGYMWASPALQQTLLQTQLLDVVYQVKKRAELQQFSSPAAATSRQLLEQLAKQGHKRPSALTKLTRALSGHKGKHGKSNPGIAAA